MIRMKIHQRGYVLSPSVSFAIPSPIGKKIEKKKNLNAALAEKKIRFLEKDLTIHTFWNFTSVHHIYLISDFSVFFLVLVEPLIPRLQSNDPYCGARWGFSLSRQDDTRIDGLIPSGTQRREEIPHRLAVGVLSRSDILSMYCMIYSTDGVYFSTFTQFALLLLPS